MVSSAGETQKKLMDTWLQNVIRAALAAANRPIAFDEAKYIAGPRAGVLLLRAGIDTGDVLNVLTKHEAALLRQTVPWPFMGEPNAFMMGNFIRLEAGWPAALSATDIPLSSIGENPRQPTRWIAGVTETGRTLTLGVNDIVGHWLIAGQTGSGKTYAQRSAIGQLARNISIWLERNGKYGAPPPVKFILIDMKRGAGFGLLRNIPAMIGPLAVDADAARRALAYANRMMVDRYRKLDEFGANIDARHKYLSTLPRIVVAIDEIQGLTGNNDELAVNLFKTLVTQGREARVHTIVGTQHPTVSVFGDSQTKQNLVGRFALRTSDWKSSEVVIGDTTPRADKLLGAGDAYAVVPESVVRLQVAYMRDNELAALNTGSPEMDEWPDVDYPATEAAERLKPYTAKEIALGIAHARDGAGRDSLKQRFVDNGLAMPGNPKATAVRDYGREILTILEDWDYFLEPPAARPPAE